MFKQSWGNTALSDSARLNQGEVIASAVMELIKSQTNVCSLLDIGAGSGNVAVPIANSVERYLAIEKNPRDVESLSNLGLEVIHAEFPTKIDETFDIVLASHSIPEGPRNLYPPFLEQAWSLVKPEGALMIITFKGRYNAPIDLLIGDLTGRQFQPDPRFNYMLEILDGYGHMQIDEINSHIQTRVLSDLETIYGHQCWQTPDQQTARLADFRRKFESDFKTNRGYKVNEPHQVIITRKE